MKIFVGILIAVALCFGWWYVGGIHLAELRTTGPVKAREMGCENLVVQGYQRAVFSGFGGRIWYQCDLKGLLFEFAVTRRINSSEVQVYNLAQKTIYPLPSK